MQSLHENNSRIVDSIANGVTGEGNQFVPGLQIEDTAWNTMVATGVSEHIEYETLHIVSSVYSFQKIYSSLAYQLVQNIMYTTALAKALGQDENFLLSDSLFLDNMQLIVLTETGLLANYAKAIEELGFLLVSLQKLLEKEPVNLHGVAQLRLYSRFY